MFYLCSHERMSRVPPIERQTLADILPLPAVEVRCHGCGRREQMEPRPLFERLRKCDCATLLHDAARFLRCFCGARQAQIVIPRETAKRRPARPAREQTAALRPWERFDRHMELYR